MDLRDFWEDRLDQIEEEYEDRYGISMEADVEIEQIFFVTAPKGTCPSEFLLDLNQDEALQPEAADQIHRHLRDCGKCSKRAVEKEQATIRVLAEFWRKSLN